MDIRINSGIQKVALLENNTHIYVEDMTMGIANTIDYAHERHRHDFFAIEFIYAGDCMQYINGKTYACIEGTVSLLSPLDDHYFINKNKDTKMLYLTFSDDVIFKQVWDTLDIESAPYVTTLSAADTEKLIEDFNILQAEARGDALLSTSLVRLTVNKIIINILRSTSNTPAVRPHKNDSMHKAISYVRYHFKEPLTMTETANHCHVTKEHFCKYFKKYTGSTFIEYLVSLRLDYALRLITTTDMPITEICMESGFSSPSYFTKAFYKRFGKKPSQLRKQ